MDFEFLPFIAHWGLFDIGDGVSDEQMESIVAEEFREIKGDTPILEKRLSVLMLPLSSSCSGEDI